MNYVKRMLLKTTAPRKGFTLLEMVVVLGIIALLMLIVIPNLNEQSKRAKSNHKLALERVINGQAAMYVNDTNGDIKDVDIAKLEKSGYINAGQAKEAKQLEIQVDQHENTLANPPEKAK